MNITLYILMDQISTVQNVKNHTKFILLFLHEIIYVYKNINFYWKFIYEFLVTVFTYYLILTYNIKVLFLLYSPGKIFTMS